MPKCEQCGKEVDLPFRCNFCGHYYCIEHRLPENHNCYGAPPRTPLGSYQTKRMYATIKVEKTQIIPQYVTKESGKPKTKTYGNIYGYHFEVPVEVYSNEESKAKLDRAKTLGEVDRIIRDYHARGLEERKDRKYRIKRRWHTRTSRKKTVRNVIIIALVTLLIGGVYHHRAFIIPTFLKFIGYVAPGIGRIISPPNITDIERAIFIYTNIERKNHGLKELIWDEKLSEIARMHSRDMAQNKFFSHINLNGEDPTARAKKYGYPISKDLGNGLVRVGIAENIGKMTTGYIVGIGWVYNDADSIAKAQVEAWMRSPGHRSNILNPSYERLGVGVAYDGSYYISTQDFW